LSRGRKNGTDSIQRQRRQAHVPNQTRGTVQHTVYVKVDLLATEWSPTEHVNNGRVDEGWRYYVVYNFYVNSVLN